MVSTREKSVISRRIKVQKEFWKGDKEITGVTMILFVHTACLASHRRHASAHRTETACELRVLLLDLKLRPRRLGVGKRVNNLALGSRKLSRPLEERERLGNLALLEEKLGHGGNSNIALGVDCNLGQAQISNGSDLGASY